MSVNKDKKLTSHLWFPREHLSEHWRNRRGWLVGFNVSGLRCNIVEIINANDVSLPECQAMLNTIEGHESASALRQHCKKKTPSVLGVLNQYVGSGTDTPPSSPRSVENEERDLVQKAKHGADIWITVNLDFESVLTVQGHHLPRPKIISTYTLGIPSRAPTEIITYDPVDSEQFHFLARSPSASRREVDLELYYARSLTFEHMPANTERIGPGGGNSSQNKNSHDNNEYEIRSSGTCFEEGDDALISDLDYTLRQINAGSVFSSLLNQAIVNLLRLRSLEESQGVANVQALQQQERSDGESDDIDHPFFRHSSSGRTGRTGRTVRTGRKRTSSFEQCQIAATTMRNVLEEFGNVAGNNNRNKNKNRNRTSNSPQKRKDKNNVDHRNRRNLGNHKNHKNQRHQGNQGNQGNHGHHGHHGHKRNQSVAQSMLYEEEEDLFAPKSCRCVCLQPLVFILMFTRLIAPTVVWCTTTRLPDVIPFVGGKRLTEISFLARALTTRVHLLCWMPIEIVAVQKPTQDGIIYPNSVRARHHIAVWSTVLVMLFDIGVGILIGCFAYYNSSRSDVILTKLHRYGNVLHMDVLTEWTIWLMGVPIGLKLNGGLASFLGTLILTILKLWNVFTSYFTLFEDIIIASLSFCGILLGCTSLIALVHDILLFMVPHVWLLYSFFSQVHQGQMYVSRSLWYLFRGKKNNVLRRRVDTLDLSLDQQLVGTILFACVLFLSLTPFVFYSFWGGVWLSVLCVHALLWFIYSCICTLPLYEIYHHLFPSSRAISGTSMLPGSIRFTVSQYDATRRNEDGSSQLYGEDGQDGEEEEDRRRSSRSINNRYQSHYHRRSKSSNGSGSNWSSRETLFDNTNDDNYDTSYLHVNGNSVGLTKLFQAFGTYIHFWLKHYSLIKFIREFLSGGNITPMTEYHAHLDYHLYRSEMTQRNKSLPSTRMMWNALQTLLLTEKS